MSDFVNGTSYTFYMFANNTVSAEDYATVMFSVAIYVAPSGGSTGGFPTNNTEPVNPEVPVEAAPDYTLLYIAAVGAGAVLLFGEEKKRKRKGLHAASLEMQNGVTRARNQKVKWKKEKVKKQNWRRGKPWD